MPGTQLKDNKQKMAADNPPVNHWAKRDGKQKRQRIAELVDRVPGLWLDPLADLGVCPRLLQR